LQEQELAQFRSGKIDRLTIYPAWFIYQDIRQPVEMDVSMDSIKPAISYSEVELFRDRLNVFTSLLHQVLKNPSLSKDPQFLHQIGEIIRLLSELSKV